jgi:hypothetical protein
LKKFGSDLLIVLPVDFFTSSLSCSTAEDIFLDSSVLRALTVLVTLSFTAMSLTLFL